MLATVSEKVGRVVVLLLDYGSEIVFLIHFNNREKRLSVDNQRHLMSTAMDRGGNKEGWQDVFEGDIFPTSVGIDYRRIEADERTLRSTLGNHSQYWSQYLARYDHPHFSSGSITD